MTLRTSRALALAVFGHVVLALAVITPPSASAAQDSLATTSPPASATPADSGGSMFARYLRYPWNGVNIWAGSAFETRTASHNEHFGGSMRVFALQISRDIFRGAKWKLGYVGEVLPVMLVRTGPPINRVPDTVSFRDPVQAARFRYREAYGFGLAPFGLEVSRQLTPGVSALMNMTAGALMFDRVIPYGEATRANFTVSPGVALQWSPVNRTRLAFGYTFHHLSNASFGGSNPGMNSQILYFRVSRVRSAALPR